MYQEIRKQTASDDIELPNVDLDTEIGGYDEVKTRLREELIALIARKDQLKDGGDIAEEDARDGLVPRATDRHDLRACEQFARNRPVVQEVVIGPCGGLTQRRHRA